MAGLKKYGLKNNMETIFILSQKVPRAETTDCSILFASNKKDILEETLLSIYEEAKEKHNDKEFLKEFINTFKIIEIPLI